MISFAARGLSSIPGHKYCYTAIMSASIVGILPGYLIYKLPVKLTSVRDSYLYSE